MLAAVMFLSGGSLANAEQQLSPGTSSTELLRAEEQVQRIFEVYLGQDSSGTWFVRDAQAAAADGISSSDLETIASDLNRAKNKKQHLQLGQRGKSPLTNDPMRIGDWNWAKCVLAFAVGTGVYELLNGTVRGWLARGKYAQVASWLIRVAPRLALRGGVIGLAAGLAAGVAACSVSHA